MTIVDDPAAPAPAKPKRAPKPKAQAVTIQTPCPPMAPQIAPAPTSMLDLIWRAASDPNIDVAKMQALIGIRDHEEERAIKLAEREAEAAFNAAMAEVQSKMGRIATDAANASTRSRYATYGALDRAIRPLYTAAGFAPSFNEDVGTVGTEMVRVICYLTHTVKGAKISHTRVYHVDIPADGKGAKGNDVMTKTHAHGSAFTYGKRYLLGMIFNIAFGVDDDGNAAGDTIITEEQATELEQLAADVGADLSKTCSYFKIADIAQLPAAKYASVKAGLEAKRSPL